ncbi:MAG: hypothetical protein ACI4W6_02190 [Acutalibacteraceae bacterium]
MTVLYIITKYLTLPGAMVRGFWEHLVCKICGIPVEDNRLIRNDEVSSHVEHELAPTSRKAFALCFVPAFMNGVLALILTIPSICGLFFFNISGALNVIPNVLAYWFAFSLYVNSYPLVEDALNMKYQVYKNGTILQKIVYAPGFLFTYVGAYAEKYCITFVLAVAGFVALLLAM